MKLFTLFLYLCFFLTIGLAMKRNAPVSKKDCASKKAKTVQPSDQISLVSDPSIPIQDLETAQALDLPEILFAILKKVLEEYPEKPEEKNPFLNLHLVSRRWNEIMSGSGIHNVLRTLPNSARHFLRIEGLYNISAKHNLDLVKCAHDILEEHELRMIMLTAEDCETIIFCSSRDRMRMYYENEYVDGYNAIMVATTVELPIYRVTDDFETKIRALIEKEKEAHFETGLIFTLPQHHYLKILFLEDLRRPKFFSWSYSLFLRCFCYNYHNHPGTHQHLANWIAPFKYAILPNTQLSLVWESLSIAIVFAALSGDRKFFEIVDFDVPFWIKKYTKNNKNSKSAELFLLLDDILCGKVKYISGKALTALEILIEIRKSYGLLGWSKETLREPLLRQQFRSEEAINAVTNLLQN